jgi:hypothetical protein
MALTSPKLKTPPTSPPSRTLSYSQFQILGSNRETLHAPCLELRISRPSMVVPPVPLTMPNTPDNPPPSVQDEQSRWKGRVSVNAIPLHTRVEATYCNGKILFPGKISNIWNYNLYDIKLDNGETASKVQRAHIRRIPSNSPRGIKARLSHHLKRLFIQ